MKSYSKMRWWSKWEIMKQLMHGDVQSFLETMEDAWLATRKKMLAKKEVLTDAGAGRYSGCWTTSSPDNIHQTLEAGQVGQTRN